jgi:membrane protein implicated in regulation of membrane protease activity
MSQMSDSTLWWSVAGAVVIVELLTGTFYLLMISIGLAAGAIAASYGLSVPLQMVSAAVVGSGAVLAWHQYRRKHPKAAPANANSDVNLDVGSEVHVADASVWQPDGSAKVHYRGAEWSAVLATEATPQAGNYLIERVQGSRLVLRNA